MKINPCSTQHLLPAPGIRPLLHCAAAASPRHGNSKRILSALLSTALPLRSFYEIQHKANTFYEIQQKANTFYEIQHTANTFYGIQHKANTFYEIQHKANTFYEIQHKANTFYEVKVLLCYIPN